MGLEVPILCEPVYPGDRFRIGLTYQMQLAPMMNPVYDSLEVNFEAFFVPYRIIDPMFKEFWTGYNEYDQMTPTDIAPLTITRFFLGAGSTDGGISTWEKGLNNPIGIGSLFDFLGYQFSSHFTNGLPVVPAASSSQVAYDLNINAYPFIAYARIYDDWYRNERTQPALLYNYYNQREYSFRSFEYEYRYENGEFSKVGLAGPDIRLFSRNYKRDRFTTALPEPVIGGDVHIPVNNALNATEPVIENTMNNAVIVGSDGNGYNLNTLALGTIEQLKFAFKEYSYRMKDTYNGNRYVESIDSHFGIRVPDSTLQRSLYLGSARDYVNFGEVYQTSSGDGNAAQGALGDYAGRGMASGSEFLFDEEFYEPGLVMILMCVTPMNRYFQGVKRLFTRFDRDDYFSPEYQNIGDDFIRNDELYNDPSSAIGANAFGFNSRWIELKTRYNELHGDFANTNGNNPLNRWNFSRSFGATPTISSEFSRIEPINKPFFDSDKRNDNYFVDIAFNFDALRPVLATESF